VEKFIGDAVMAVFGVPAVHEDDALRACRAAVEMQTAFPELGVQARIGVNTGEVITGTEERLATGDAVNIAARLQQAAEPNEVLIGATTLALVRAAVAVEAVEALPLKGKSGSSASRRRPSAHTNRRSSAANASSGCSERPGRAPDGSVDASSSRSSPRRASGRRASSPRPSPTYRLASSAAAAFPTAKESRTGP
jgi:hypothetical protein